MVAHDTGTPDALVLAINIGTFDRRGDRAPPPPRLAQTPPALSRIARRIASDLLIPVASSCARACIASESSRTLMADDMPLNVSRSVLQAGPHPGATRTQMPFVGTSVGP